jgi:hypothetical protein
MGEVMIVLLLMVTPAVGINIRLTRQKTFTEYHEGFL